MLHADHATRCLAAEVVAQALQHRDAFQSLSGTDQCRQQLSDLVPSLVFLAGRHRSPDSFQGKHLVRLCAQVSVDGMRRALLSMCVHTVPTWYWQALANSASLAATTPQGWWLSDARSLAWVERLRFDREASVRASALTSQGHLLHTRWARVQLVHGVSVSSTAASANAGRAEASGLVPSALRLVLSKSEPPAVRAAAAETLRGYVTGCAASAGGSDAAAPTAGAEIVWLQPFLQASFFSHASRLLAHPSAPVVASTVALLRQLLVAAPQACGSALMQVDLWPHLLAVLDRVRPVDGTAVPATACAAASVFVMVRFALWTTPRLRRYFVAPASTTLPRVVQVLAVVIASAGSGGLAKCHRAVLCGGLLLLAELVRPTGDTDAGVLAPDDSGASAARLLQVVAYATEADRALSVRCVGAFLAGCLTTSTAWANAWQRLWASNGVNAGDGSAAEGMDGAELSSDAGDRDVGHVITLNLVELYMELLTQPPPAHELAPACAMLALDGGEDVAAATMAKDVARSLRAVLEMCTSLCWLGVHAPCVDRDSH